MFKLTIFPHLKFVELAAGPGGIFFFHDLQAPVA